MTTLTLRRIKDDFLVTGPDIEPMKFNSRREAKDWCRTHYPGSPITEIGANRLKRIVVAAKGRPNGVPRTDRDEVTQLSRLVDQAAWNAWKAWAKLQDAESRRAAPRPVESRYNRAYLCTGGRDGQEDRAR